MDQAAAPQQQIGQAKGAQGQHQGQHCAPGQLSARRVGQQAAQPFFQPGDAFAHEHHRVGQPMGVAKEQVQPIAQQQGPKGRHSRPPSSRARQGQSRRFSPSHRAA